MAIVITTGEGFTRDDGKEVFLSKREKEVIELIMKGESSKEIGSLLGITVKTVEVHRHNILKALNMRNTVQMIVWLMRKGIMK